MGEDLVNLQDIGARLVIYGDINNDKMPYFNPSLAWDDDALAISIRSCNFTTIRHGKWTFLDDNIYSRTDVMYGYIDPDTLEIIKLEKLKLDSNTPIQTRIAGLEDVRLYKRGNRMHAIGFEVDRVTPCYYKKSGMAVYIINNGKLHYQESLEKPNPDIVEKNWQPTDVQTRFDFTYSPTQTYQGGQLWGTPYTGNIHGGTQLLRQEDDTYISLVHEKIEDKRFGNVYDKYVYITYLAVHDELGIITKRSKGFRFGTYENIEFASGMVQHGDDLLISLGIRDAKFAIARIKKSKLMELL